MFFQIYSNTGAEEVSARRLSGFLLTGYTDKVTTSGRDGSWVGRLHFDH
jgi:hypothetical protein